MSVLEHEEALARLAASGALHPDDLEPLVDVMAALESSTVVAGVDELARGLAAALGDETAVAVCAGALRPADVAARFFRLRALVRAASSLRDA